MTSVSRLTFTSIEIGRRPNPGSIPSRLARNLGFGSRELQAIERVIIENREAFLRAWNEYFGS
jgi:hypothetical protein